MDFSWLDFRFFVGCLTGIAIVSSPCLIIFLIFVRDDIEYETEEQQ